MPRKWDVRLANQEPNWWRVSHGLVLMQKLQPTTACLTHRNQATGSPALSPPPDTGVSGTQGCDTQECGTQGCGPA